MNYKTLGNVAQLDSDHSATDHDEATPLYKIGEKKPLQSRNQMLRRSVCFVGRILVFGLLGTGTFGWAQDGDIPVDAAMIQALQAPDVAPQAELAEPAGIDLMALITSGGYFMLPIGFMSVLVVTLAVERLVSLRRKRVVPKRLLKQLNEWSTPSDSFDPEKVYQVCDQHRSVAGRVVQAMLLRTGQSLADVERAGTETIQREADKYAGPIRWLHLAAAATPLLGLLGTVWGMIKAFHESTSLAAGRSRSEQLSEGIYTALVTTLAGLIVAIPAAIIAQYLENRIAKQFRKVEELAFRIAPGVDRFRGRMRLDPQRGLRPLVGAVQPPPRPGKPPANSAPKPVSPRSGASSVVGVKPKA